MVQFLQRQESCAGDLVGRSSSLLVEVDVTGRDDDETSDPLRSEVIGDRPEDRFDLPSHVFLRHLFEPTGSSPDVDDRGDLLDERLILRFEVSLSPNGSIVSSSSRTGLSALLAIRRRQGTGQQPAAQYRSLMALEG
jgi:hypothetical protein